MAPKDSLFSIFLLFLVVLVSQVCCGNPATPEPIIPNTAFPKDFNFHNKDLFLKAFIRRLIECIEPGDSNTSALVLPENETLLKKVANGKEAFVFDYKGNRRYNETCLGDTYKKDLLIRLYDAACYPYSEKIRFLNQVSCDSDQNLECRQVAVEAKRQFAEQATPIMRCRCPDYSQSQADLQNRSQGYYDKKRKQCVLKAGRLCAFSVATLKTLDKRTNWTDLDYKDGAGIQVIDGRPMASTYPCVTNAFCYIGDNKGLEIKDVYREKCVCDAGYFISGNSECMKGRQAPTWPSIVLTILMFSIGMFTFIVVALF